MRAANTIVSALICFSMACVCHAKELVFMYESDGDTPKIEYYKEEVIEELTRRCLRAKVASNAIVDTVVDGDGQILKISLSSTRLDPKVERSLTAQLKTIKFGSRVTGTAGYLKMTLRFTVDPRLLELKAADDALMKKMHPLPPVSGKEFASRIQLAWDQRVALEKRSKAIWASFGKPFPRYDREMALVKYSKNAEDYLALGLRALAAKEFLSASQEAFVGGKPKEGKAFVGRAISLSNQLTWHQNRHIYKELCLQTGRLVNSPYKTVSKEVARFLYQSVESFRLSLLSREPKKQSVLLKLSSGLNVTPSLGLICGTGRPRFSGGETVKRKLSALESSVESCRRRASSVSRSNKQQAVEELKEALKLMEFEYGENSIECLPELCKILQLEMEQRHAEEAFKTARQVYTVAEHFEVGEEIEREDEWGGQQGLNDLEALARESFGSHYTYYENCSSWKKPIAEILFRSEYMLTMKTNGFEWPAIQETLLNLCGFLANYDNANESITLLNQSIAAYKEVHPSGVQGLTAEYTVLLKRAEKGEMLREKNFIGAKPKRPDKNAPQK